jgi:hypothetical protein
MAMRGAGLFLPTSHPTINPRRLNTALLRYTMLHSVHIGMQFFMVSGDLGSQWPFSRAVFM